MESQELEINTSDGDLFSEHLVLEESLRDELPTVEQIVGTQERQDDNEEPKLARSQSTESVCFDEIEEPIQNSDKAIIAETPIEDALSDANDIAEETEIIPETQLDTEIADETNKQIEIEESEILETEVEPLIIEETEFQETEMEDKENEVTTSDEVEKMNPPVEQTDLKLNLDSELSRKRKALVESDIPNKINKIEVSSNDSTISLSVLSGKINLNDVKSSSEEATSSVEIIEEVSPQVASIVLDPSPDLDEGKGKKVDINVDLEEEKLVDVEKESDVDMEKDEKLSKIEVRKESDPEGQKESCGDVEKEESYNGLDTINEESDHKDHSCNQADFSGKISPINKSSSDATLKFDDHRGDKIFHKKIIYVEITYEPEHREITNVLCDDVTDLNNFTSSKRVSDVSAGVLGDVSKNNSPTSTTSTGPFPLPNRFSTISNSSRYSTLSRFSTSSTSSTLSSASALAKFRAHDAFLIPDIPNKSKTQSPRPLSDDQILNLRNRWKNSELLFGILDTIDHQSIDSNKNSPIHRPKTPEMEKVVELAEEGTPKSVKRSVRKKKPINLVLPGEEEAPPRSASKTSTPVNRTKSGRKKRVNSSSKEEAESGRKRKEVEVTEELEPVSENGITVGDRVFARWTDRKYYSGTVNNRNKEKWNINFDDGANLLLTEDYIIPSYYDKLSGQTVFTQIDDKEPYQGGIIVAVSEQTKTFKIDLDDGSNVEVSPKRICFSEDQAKNIKENIGLHIKSPGTPSSAVSLENLVYGKRSRSTNKAASVASPRTVAVLGLKTRRKLNKGFQPSEDEDSKSIASEEGLEDKQLSTPVKSSKGNLKTKSARKFNGTKTPASPQPGISGTRTATPRRVFSESEQSDVVEGAQSDIVEGVSGLEPEFKVISTPVKTSKGPGRAKGKNTTNSAKKSENSNIFNGLSFILACVHTPLNINQESSGAETDTELKSFTKIPFIEEELKAQIISGGGTVYQHFEEIPSSEYPNCKLISNRPNRTAKYIQCIAAGIAVLSHEWIINCSSVKKRLTFQELPIGWSIEKNQFIEPFQKINSKPFQNLLIYLAPNDDKDFIKFWNRVCSLAGGVVVVMENGDEDFQTATLVLAESDCPKEVVNRANDWNIPLLSTTWIVQSIIHGEPRAFDTQLLYSYNHIQYDD